MSDSAAAEAQGESAALRSDQLSVEKQVDAVAEQSSSVQHVAESKRIKRKKMPRLSGGVVLNIEELFVSVSKVVASGINPPPGHVIMTPRSAESCLMHGVNPEILRIRDLDSFYEPDIEQEVQQLRHDVYSQRRHEMMRLCRQERKRLQNAEQTALAVAAAASGPSKSVTLTPQQLLEAAAAHGATMIEVEERRIEKMRRRQEKEIEQLLAWELQMKAVAEENEAKREHEALQAEQRRRERERRQRALAEERRLRELKKEAQESAEEQQKAALSREQHKRDALIAKEKRRQERKALAEARQRDQERAKKAEEHKEQTARIAQAQQHRILQRMEEMAEQEAVRIAKVEEKLRQDREEKQARRAEVEARIAANLRMATAAEAARKDAFYSKKEAHEQHRAALLSEREAEREAAAAAHAAAEQKRAVILRQTRAAEQRKRDSGLAQFEAEEAYLRQLQADRDRERRIQRERNDLQNQLKQENVDRMARIQEYRRLETLRKIAEADQRTTNMAKRRQELIDQRRQAALEVKQQRDTIAHIMEEAKRNRARAARMLKEAMGGAATGSSTAASGSVTSSNGSKKGGRPATEGKKRAADATKHRQQQQPAVVGLMRSKSAEHSGKGTLLGPAPDAPTLAARLRGSSSSSAAQLPQAYVSPYEQVMLPPAAAVAATAVTVTL